MISKKALVSCIALFAVAFFAIASVSAFAVTSSLEIDDMDAFASEPLAITAGQTVTVELAFLATSDAEDVRVKAWMTGEKDLSSVTDKFDVIKGNTYKKTLTIKVPSTLSEDDLSEALNLVVVVENSNDGEALREDVQLTLQRESYQLDVLDAKMDSEAKAGDVLAIDVVLKNRGSHFSEDTFVVVRIPALGIQDRVYFGDLAPVDEPKVDDEYERLDEVDSAERRLFLKIPSSAPVGVYVVEVEAVNGDTITTLTKKVVISGAEANTVVVAPVHSKSFDAGSSAEYSIVLVNSGSKLAMFELVVDSPTDLNVDVSEPIVVVPAGSSKTVKLTVTSDKVGTQNFAVNVHSGTQLVKSESFTANVQGSNKTLVTTSPTVLLTVVLAVIFVVLLIVLIVLLTRKPEKSEEYGESYY